MQFCSQGEHGHPSLDTAAGCRHATQTSHADTPARRSAVHVLPATITLCFHLSKAGHRHERAHTSLVSCPNHFFPQGLPALPPSLSTFKSHFGKHHPPEHRPTSNPEVTVPRHLSEATGPTRVPVLRGGQLTGAMIAAPARLPLDTSSHHPRSWQGGEEAVSDRGACCPCLPVQSPQ